MEEDRPTKIFVGNLPWSLDDETLAQLFEQYGEVLAAGVVVDAITGQSRGFGFVDMPHPEQAFVAIEALQKFEVAGRPLNVSPARTQERSAS